MNCEEQDKADEETRERGEAYPDDDLEKLKRVLAEFWRWLQDKNISPSQWIQAIASVALVFVTIGQLVVACSNSSQTQSLIEATTSSAQTAKDSLVTSERAYLVAMDPTVDQKLNLVDLGVINIGHIPSSNGKMTVFEITVRRGTQTEHLGFPIGKKIEGHWRDFSVPEISYATPPLIREPFPSFNDAEYLKENLAVIVAGKIRYRDGFADTPEHVIPFCRELFWNLKRGTDDREACDPEAMTERIKSAIKFPDHRFSEP